MHSLTICFGPTGTAWTLLFKTEEKATEARMRASSRPSKEATHFSLHDDFGQSCDFTFEGIHGVMLEDMSLAIEAQVERGLYQARAQAKAEVRAMTDPVIKEGLQRRNQGPAIYQPGMNGRMS